MTEASLSPSVRRASELASVVSVVQLATEATGSSDGELA
jgi:hypothetical protein